MFVVRRDPRNPLIAPSAQQPWRARAAFNPSVVVEDSRTVLYFRAVPETSPVIAPFNTGSVIGRAESPDGDAFGLPEITLKPTEPWEAFGVEDPRAVVLDGRTYLTYTALGGYPYSAENIKAAIAVSDDGITFNERHLMTPFNAKAFALFPRKVNGRYAAILTAHTDYTPEYPRPVIALAQAKKIEDFWDPAFWEEWHANLDAHALPDLRRADEDHVEVGASPVYTEDGWLLIYSYISHYYDESRRSFGIEALLLDLNDPKKVLNRTYPFLTPEMDYERNGMVPNIVFPSSAAIYKKENLEMYYGGADTVCARASVRLSDLLDTLTGRGPAFRRAPENPILRPIPQNPFESKLVFNPAAIDLDGSVHILYRASDDANTSTVGYARSADGIHIDERLPVPIYGPRGDFELKRSSPTGNSGVEDPRAVVLDDRLYLTYTAYDGVHVPRGAIASISLDDFRAQQFQNWSEPKLMTPDNVDDKDVSLLPEKVGGKYVLYHRVNGRICADILDDLDFAERTGQCIDVLGPRPGMWDSAKVGIAGPPLRVPDGWLIFYHGVSEHSHYRIGAVLLENDGITVVARSADPIFEPIEQYEREGEIPNVVFPCGAVVRDGTIYLYYGGADTVVGVATASLAGFLAALS